VGRLSKQKNIPTLLTALALTNRDVHLDIVGEGPEEAAIQNLIADLELSNVTLRGRLSRAEVMELYATCNALVMPSLYEAQPLVLLEAMAARIPVICTNVIGVKEHIGDGGIVVEPTSIGLADGIEHYYKHYDTLPQLVEKAYHKAEDMRWPPTLKRYETLYEEVLGA
ncbi:MAG TPA: glycosyltransferase, partial [Candidatus Acidoferrum sp.]|nr:glycosyltransferase [Candidatus Acidoferrum sp.]